MDGNLSQMSESNFWKVRAPSREFRNLPADVRDSISEYLAEYPVKLGEIAKKLGITVLVSTLPRGVSGQISVEDNRFVIRINRHEARHRQRFTLAHEIAHYLLHKDRILATGGWSENVLLRSGQPEVIEYEANRLASDLVLPSEQLAKATSTYVGPMTSEVIEDLARRFGVSTAAMEIKLQLD